MIQPLISVIIPIHNQEKWIGRCLRSILNQSIDREKFEIIVINDGSTDKSQYALELFKDEIILIDNDSNIGLPASLNKGIKSSRSKYVVRIDGDDYVNHDFLYFLSNFIEQNKYMDAVSCDYYLVNDKEETLERMNCEKSPIGCGIIFQTKHLLEIGLYD